MTLSKRFDQVFGIGDMWRRAIYNLIKEVDDKVSALDGTGEIELGMLEPSTEAKIIVYDAQGVAQDVAVSGDIAIAANGATTIQADAVGETEIDSDAVQKDQLGYRVKTVTVSTGQSSGASVDDALLIGGQVLGIYPNGNQDQFVDDIEIGAGGAVTVTLAAAATADNIFDVVVLRA